MKTPFLYQVRALLLAAVLPLAASAASESPSLLLQKGIYAEEIERNLDSAIKIYLQIGAEAAANRTVVAQAQYRLATCYQKKGNNEQAVKLLNELVQQSQPDPGVVKNALETLAKLGVTPAEALTARKLTVSSTAAWYMAVSPDGRFIAYMPSEGNDVLVHELATGKNWTAIKGTKEKYPTGWIPAIFSPDGQWIGYDLDESAIYVSRVDGSETRKLFEKVPAGERKKGDGTWVTILGWAADGTQVILTSWDNACNCRVVFSADVRTGATREIARPSKLEGPTSALWRLSADGRYLARQSGVAPRKIYLLDLNSNGEEILEVRDHVVTEDNASLLGWTLGDTKLLFSEYRGGEVDLWAIPVKDGKTSGEVEPVLRNIRSFFSSGEVLRSGLTRQGSVYYWSIEGPQRSLWAMEGFLTKKAPGNWKEIPPEHFLGPNNSMNDRTFGLVAAIPEGCFISSAIRSLSPSGAEQRDISLQLPAVRTAQLSVNYRLREFLVFPALFASAPPSADQLAAALQGYARNQTDQESKRYPDFKVRTESLAVRSTAESTVISGTADYTTSGKPYVFLWSTHYTKDIRAAVVMRVSAAALEEARPAFVGVTESLRFQPSNRLNEVKRSRGETLIPLEELLRGDQSLHEPKTGVSIRLPAGWKPVVAVRDMKTLLATWRFLVIIELLPESIEANASVAYFSAEDQQAIPGAGVEAWLRKWAEVTYPEFVKKQRSWEDYRVRPGSVSTRKVGGRPTMTWVGDYTSGRTQFTHYTALIYSESGNAWVQIQARSPEAEKLRAGFESMLESVRLP